MCIYIYIVPLVSWLKDVDRCWIQQGPPRSAQRQPHRRHTHLSPWPRFRPHHGLPLASPGSDKWGAKMWVPQTIGCPISSNFGSWAKFEETCIRRWTKWLNPLGAKSSSRSRSLWSQWFFPLGPSGTMTNGHDHLLQLTSDTIWRWIHVFFFPKWINWSILLLPSSPCNTPPYHAGKPTTASNNPQCFPTTTRRTRKLEQQVPIWKYRVNFLFLDWKKRSHGCVQPD